MNSQSNEPEGRKAAKNKEANSVAPKGEDDIASGKPSGDQTNHANDQAYWERRQFKVQRLIAYAGVLGLIIYGLQLWEMRKSTNAATDAARAAEASIKLATENAHLDQRAWIGVMTINGTPEVDKRFKATVLFKNTGKTSASKVTLRISVYRAPIWMLPDFDKLEEDIASRSNGLVPPDGTYFGVITTEGDIDKQEMQSIEMGLTIVYIFGKSTYVDIFGCEHWTTFAYILGGDHEVGWEHNAYQTHNETDNNCGPTVKAK